MVAAMLKKELLELCLLQQLSKGAEYGYELLRRLHGAFPDTQESAIYAILRGLCRDGCTRSFQGVTSEGPARKYYELTPAGREKLLALLKEWRAMRDALAELGIV